MTEVPRNEGCDGTLLLLFVYHFYATHNNSPLLRHRSPDLKGFSHDIAPVCSFIHTTRQDVDQYLYEWRRPSFRAATSEGYVESILYVDV
jgi:hypothetical protein